MYSTLKFTKYAINFCKRPYAQHNIVYLELKLKGHQHCKTVGSIVTMGDRIDLTSVAKLIML